MNLNEPSSTDFFQKNRECLSAFLFLLYKWLKFFKKSYIFV